MLKIFTFLSIFMIVACSKTVDIQLDPEIIAIPSESREKRITLSSKDNEYVLLNDWLRENNSSWNNTSGRYPGGVYIISGDNGIQVTRTHVVIYSTKNPEPEAIYIQKVYNGELNSIREIGQ